MSIDSHEEPTRSTEPMTTQEYLDGFPIIAAIWASGILFASWSMASALESWSPVGLGLLLIAALAGIFRMAWPLTPKYPGLDAAFGMVGGMCIWSVGITTACIFGLRVCP